MALPCPSLDAAAPANAPAARRCLGLLWQGWPRQRQYMPGAPALPGPHALACLLMSSTDLTVLLALCCLLPRFREALEAAVIIAVLLQIMNKLQMPRLKKWGEWVAWGRWAMGSRCCFQVAVRAACGRWAGGEEREGSTRWLAEVTPGLVVRLGGLSWCGERGGMVAAGAPPCRHPC